MRDLLEKEVQEQIILHEEGKVKCGSYDIISDSSGICKVDNILVGPIGCDHPEYCKKSNEYKGEID